MRIPRNANDCRKVKRALDDAERMIEAARRALSSVAESMTEHAYQELASALESPPRHMLQELSKL